MSCRDHAGIVAVVLAAGVAVALPAALIIVALKGGSTPADAELIATVSTLAAAAMGAVGGYLARTRERPPPPGDEPEGPAAGGGHVHIPGQRNGNGDG